jgi:hypothetical protein
MLTRELLGRVGQGGWRPALIGWGIGIPLVALFWIIVIRFAMGATTIMDLVAFGGMLAQFARYVELRGAPSQPSPTGGLVNNHAIA